jgi:hypothetical protein
VLVGELPVGVTSNYDTPVRRILADIVFTVRSPHTGHDKHLQSEKSHRVKISADFTQTPWNPELHWTRLSSIQSEKSLRVKDPVKPFGEEEVNTKTPNNETVGDLSLRYHSVSRLVDTIDWRTKIKSTMTTAMMRIFWISVLVSRARSCCLFFGRTFQPSEDARVAGKRRARTRCWQGRDVAKAMHGLEQVWQELPSPSWSRWTDWL